MSFSCFSLEGPYTFFVPTDAVFHKLGVVELNNLLADHEKLKLIIQYHIARTFILSDIIGTSGPVNVPTLNSAATLRVEATGGVSKYANIGTKKKTPGTWTKKKRWVTC